MINSTNPPILVVGAGPTGLTMACELVRHGAAACRIIEKAPKPDDKTKALAVHARTLELFDRMGIADRAIALGVQAVTNNIFGNGRLLARISFEHLESRYKYALMLPQSETERILDERLRSLGAAVERNVELLGFSQDLNGVSATLKRADGTTDTARFAWLVGCDGAHSTVRHSLGEIFAGIEYETLFSLADMEVELTNPENELFVFLTPSGPVAFFPIGRGRYRLVAATPDADSQTPPTLQEFQTIADGCVPGHIRLHDPHWLERFRIHRRSVNDYRMGRVFLAGDAAHIHSPAGGQGMNTGIQDACNLAWKLALVETGAAHESILDSYQPERHAVSAEVLKTSDVMTQIATMHGSISMALREHLLPILSAHEVFTKQLEKRITGLAIDYRNSPIVAEHRAGVTQRLKSAISRPGAIAQEFGFAFGPKAGARAPDAEPLITNNGAERFSTVTRGIEHHLALFAGANPSANDLSALAAVAEAAQRRCGQHLACHLALEGTSLLRIAGLNVIADPSGALHQAYGAKMKQCLYIIRPDGYIGFRSEPPEISTMIDYLDRIFLPDAANV